MFVLWGLFFFNFFIFHFKSNIRLCPFILLQTISLRLPIIPTKLGWMSSRCVFFFFCFVCLPHCKEKWKCWFLFFKLKNTPQFYTLLIFSAVIEIVMAKRGFLVGEALWAVIRFWLSADLYSPRNLSVAISFTPLSAWGFLFSAAGTDSLLPFKAAAA